MSGNYIFLSYSHKDTGKIKNTIDWLEAHYNVWYDKNLGAAREYNEEIADQIRNAEIVIAFISESYMQSPYCRDEIMYARTKGVEILGIFLDQVQMSEGMQLRLGRFQMLNFSEDMDYEKIMSNQHMEKCEKSEQKENLLKNLNQLREEQKAGQLPRMLFVSDFDRAERFSTCGTWEEEESGTIRVPIGLRQSMEKTDITEAYYDTANGHQFIYGNTMSGKSTLLQTIAAGLMDHYNPDTVQFYMIDFGNYMMELFSGSPHVGDIMNQGEREKLERFFLFMEKELKERVAFFRNGSFGAYARKYGKEKPLILIVIDGFEIFCDEFLNKEENEKIFKMLLRDGMRAGILFLLAKGTVKRGMYEFAMENVRTLAAFGYDKADLYDKVFQENTEFSDAAKMRIREENFELPGRGLLKNGKKMYVMQAALPLSVAEEYDRYDAIVEKCRDMHQGWNGKPAKKVPFVPGNLTMEQFASLPEVKEVQETRGKIPLGLSTYTAMVKEVSLEDNLIFPIVGEAGSGRSNALHLMLKEIMRQQGTVLLIDPKRNYAFGLEEENRERFVKASSSVELYDLCAKLMELQKKRKETPNQEGPMVVAIDGLREFYRLLEEPFSKERNTGRFLLNVMEKAGKAGIHFLITTDAARLKRAFDEPVEGMTKLIQNGWLQGLFLGGNLAEEDFLTMDFKQRKIFDYNLSVTHGKGGAVFMDKGAMDRSNVIIVPKMNEQMI